MTILRKLVPVVALGVVLVLQSVAAGFAQDFVKSSGKLSDSDFYRLVACSASPGGDCRKPFTKWPSTTRRNLTVTIMQIDQGFPDIKRRAIHNSILHATSEINGIGADINLTFMSGGRTDISVYLTNTREGAVITGTGNKDLDGQSFGVDGVALVSATWLTNSGTILDAAIAISRDIDHSDIKSAVLEEITQSLGLLTDIKNTYYTRRSIFSEDGNLVIKLRGQDATALRMHYPH